MGISAALLFALAALPFSPPAQAPTDQDYRKALGHFRAGMEALQTEHFEQAEEEFTAATRLDPDFDAAFYGLGQVHMRTHQYERAVRDYVACREAYTRATAAEAMGSIEADRRLRDRIDVLRDALRSPQRVAQDVDPNAQDRKSTRLNSSHPSTSYAVFCLKKKKKTHRLVFGSYWSVVQMLQLQWLSFNRSADATRTHLVDR